MGPKVIEPTAAEHHWVAAGNALAGKIAQEYGHYVRAGDVIAPSVLDNIWARWLIDRDPNEDPNPYINAFGLAFGWYLVDTLAMEWRVVQNREGTEIAVWGREGDVLVFPPNLVGKRFVVGTTSFFVDVARQTEETVAEVRSNTATPVTKSGLGRLFRRG